MSIVATILLFFIQALALKMAVAVMAERTTENAYGTAVRLSLGLIVANFILGLLLPNFIAWFVYLGLWCFVVMKTYRFGFVKSIFVAGLMKVLAWLLVLIMGRFFDLSNLGIFG